jgi:aryl carrier-like protein
MLGFKISNFAISFKNIDYNPPITFIQINIIQTYKTILGSNSMNIKSDHNLHQLGLSSIDLLRLKANLRKNLSISDIQIAVLFFNTVAKDFAAYIELQFQSKRLHSIVVFKPPNTIPSLQCNRTETRFRSFCSIRALVEFLSS